MEFQTFEDYKSVNEDSMGIVNIHIDGEGAIKNSIISDIRKALNKYQGKRHLFIDGKEVNPYK